MKKKFQLIKNYSPLIISILIFIFLLLPYLGSLPYLDGAIDLVQINDFFSGGFARLFNNWGSIHPPFKVFLGSISFSIFGVNTIAYSIIGIIFGIIALISMWVFVNKLFNKKVAIISVLLLSTAPLFLVNGLFAMTDYLLACMILLSLTLYIFNKRILLTITFCISVMIKETALLLPCAFMVVEILFTINSWRLKKTRFHWKSFLLSILPAVLPLLLFYGWLQFLNYNNKGVWSDWVFVESSDKGTFSVIVNNILSFSFLNKYAFQNWNQLLLLNFNWVMFGIIILGTFFSLWRLTNQQKAKIRGLIFDADLKIKTVGVIIIFFLAYFILVLSFQTYTITRYGLPLIPLVIIYYAKILYEFTKGKIVLEIISVLLISTITILSLYKSIDPVSIQLWGKDNIAGEEMISLHKNLSGNDGLVYNLQALNISKHRSILANEANDRGTSIYSSSCNWMLPDINNDRKIFDIFGLTKLQPQCESIR